MIAREKREREKGRREKRREKGGVVNQRK